MARRTNGLAVSRARRHIMTRDHSGRLVRVVLEPSFPVVRPQFVRIGQDDVEHTALALTVAGPCDLLSVYLLTCEALSTTQEKFAFTVFERTFKEFGLPRGIRTDNAVPFASAHAIYGLSKLSVW